MSQIFRPFLGMFVVVAMCVAGFGQAQAQSKSGTIAITATSVAAGVGWTWGSGKLTLLDGSEHDLRISGLDVVAVGVKQVTAVGEVLNLAKVTDIEGVYTAGSAAATVGGGAGAATMKNDKGVRIRITSRGQGVDFRLAVSGMKVALRK